MLLLHVERRETLWVTLVGVGDMTGSLAIDVSAFCTFNRVQNCYWSCWCSPFTPTVNFCTIMGYFLLLISSPCSWTVTRWRHIWLWATAPQFSQQRPSRESVLRNDKSCWKQHVVTWLARLIHCQAQARVWWRYILLFTVLSSLKTIVWSLFLLHR